jgi:hypothetical protein
MRVQTANCENQWELSNMLVEISSCFIHTEIAVFCDVWPCGLSDVFDVLEKKLYKFLGLLRCWK